MEAVVLLDFKGSAGGDAALGAAAGAFPAADAAFGNPVALGVDFAAAEGVLSPEDGADADPYAFPEDEPPADPYSSPEDAPSENAENGADAWDYDDTSYEEDDTVRYDGESN